MGVDFLDAAYRHWSDAMYLCDGERFATADHLYGLSAECAIKAILVASGVPIEADGSPKRGSLYRCHLPKLWDEFARFSPGLSARYSTRLGANPFWKWSIDDRYTHHSLVQSDAHRQHEHRESARHVLAVLDLARMDGLV
jgi:hypothetical protein